MADNPLVQQMREMIANARQDFLTRSEPFGPFTVEEETLRQSIAQADRRGVRAPSARCVQAGAGDAAVIGTH